MIFALLWAVASAAFVVLSVPVVLFFAPALYAYRETYATQGRDAANGAFVLTLVYTLLVLHWVQTPFYLILLLVVVPVLIGKVLRS
jgi:hypothetical protein